MLTQEYNIAGHNFIRNMDLTDANYTYRQRKLIFILTDVINLLIFNSKLDADLV